MDLENFLIGTILTLTGVIILIYQQRSGDFEGNSKWTQNTVGLFGGAIIGVIGGLYFLITSF